MLKLIKKLKNISNNISGYVMSNNSKCVSRKRKNNITDAVLYKLYNTQNNSTQDKSTIKVNKYAINKQKSSRQALVKKESKLTITFYKKLAEKLNNEINKNLVSNRAQQVIAVDGTYTTMVNDLSNDGYILNKNKQSVTALITGLYNATYNYPVMLEMIKHKNERAAFMDLIKNKEGYSNTIFVFDRGYAGDKLFRYMCTNKLQFVCRIKENSSLISSTRGGDNVTVDGETNKVVNGETNRTLDGETNEVVDGETNRMVDGGANGSANNTLNDIITQLSDGTPVRAVKYTIKGKNYYLATNLMNTKDHTINNLKNIYHDRWSIEEYFKHVKTSMNLKKINEKKHKNIIKSVYGNLIVSQITHIFNNLNKVYEKETKKVNKSLLTTGIYDEFLYKFFTGGRLTKSFMLVFFKTYIKYVKHKLNRTTTRECKRPNFLSYFKNFVDNPKSTCNKNSA